ncbi:MAG: nucleotidyltransferase domain-containing protein [Gammaproteobacteria bacterium]
MKPERQSSVSYTTGEAIDRLVGRIVEDVHPLRVLLFGSATRGELAAGSDIDLLVVMPDGTHRRRTAQHLYRRMRGIGVPFDIVVATPRDLDRYKDNIGLIYRTILLEGREVYAA